MRKSILILLTGIVITGCSALRSRTTFVDSENKRNTTNSEKIISQNLSSISFILSKIEIVVEEGGEKQKLIGNVKCVFPDKFLLSLRNSTGIEGARIYIDKDTILANDRINRKMYYGSSKHLFEKYGISAEYIPVLFGDMVNNDKALKDELKCNNGLAEINILSGNNKIQYNIDCTKDKIVKARITAESGKDQVIAEFSNFKELNDHFYPANIKINDVFSGNIINIKIVKAELYDGKDLVLIPGKNYDLILLQ